MKLEMNAFEKKMRDKAMVLVYAKNPESNNNDEDRWWTGKVFFNFMRDRTVPDWKGVHCSLPFLRPIWAMFLNLTMNSECGMTLKILNTFCSLTAIASATRVTTPRILFALHYSSFYP